MCVFVCVCVCVCIARVRPNFDSKNGRFFADFQAVAVPP